MERAYIYRSGQPKGHTVTPAAYPLWHGAPITPEDPHKMLPLASLEAERPRAIAANERGLHNGPHQ